MTYDERVLTYVRKRRSPNILHCDKPGIGIVMQ
jgi:hypothetical protein